VTGWNRAMNLSNHSLPFRDDDEDQHRLQQNSKRNLETRGTGDEDLHDRREREQHDEIVDGHLHERVCGIAVRQIRPHEHHGRAWCCGQDDDAGCVLARELPSDQRKEKVLKEQPAKQRHRERLHEPVDRNRDQQSLRPPPRAHDRSEIDLEHHGVDHQPDQQRHRHVDVTAGPEFEMLQCAYGVGQKLAEDQARSHAEPDPERQVALEPIQPLRSGCHSFLKACPCAH
jgi:hypothetical protein